MVKHITYIGLAWFMWACGYTPIPKPRGYFRLDMPERVYQLYSNDRYSFEYPIYGRVLPDFSEGSDKYWLNVDFPSLNGRIHITHYPLSRYHIERDTMLEKLINDSYYFVYKHTIRADGILGKEYSFPKKKVFGVYYTILGNVASYRQFYVTDSISSFVRASFYLKEEPDKDSLKPVVDFLSEDLKYMMETFRWK